MKGRGNSAPIEGYLGSEGAAEYLGLTPMRCICWSRTGSCHSSESAEAGLIVVHGHVAVGETFRPGSLADRRTPSSAGTSETDRPRAIRTNGSARRRCTRISAINGVEEVEGASSSWRPDARWAGRGARAEGIESGKDRGTVQTLGSFFTRRRRGIRPSPPAKDGFPGLADGARDRRPDPDEVFGHQ